jgi:hypothetical protein
MLKIQKKDSAHSASTAVLEQEAEEAAGCAGPGECECPSCGLSAATGLVMNVTSKPVTAFKGAAVESWADGTPNTSLILGAGYTAEPDDLARTRHIALLLVSSTASIDPGLRNAYVDGTDQIRQHRVIGP